MTSPAAPVPLHADNLAGLRSAHGREDHAAPRSWDPSTPRRVALRPTSANEKPRSIRSHAHLATDRVDKCLFVQGWFARRPRRRRRASVSDLR
jgi:hypothetical protein